MILKINVAPGEPRVVVVSDRDGEFHRMHRSELPNRLDRELRKVSAIFCDALVTASGEISWGNPKRDHTW